MRTQLFKACNEGIVTGHNSYRFSKVEPEFDGSSTYHFHDGWNTICGAVR